MRASVYKDNSVLFFNKKALDKAISRMDTQSIVKREENIKNGTFNSSGYILEDYCDLIDSHLISTFPEYSNEIKNCYINLYHYILDEIIPTEAEK